MKRKRLLASTFLVLALTAVAAHADHRWLRYQRPGTLNREQYFRMLDRNHDGFVSQREYDGPLPFAWADRNRDGYLSWYEWRESRVAARRWRAGDRSYANVDSERLSDFLRLDRNDDEFLSRGEWRASSWTFSRLDRDADGFIHITEFLGL